MSLKPDDIRRVASILTTVAECEERAHRPILATLHAIVEVPQSPEPGPTWHDAPNALFMEAAQRGRDCGLKFAELRCTDGWWSVVWLRGDGTSLASTKQLTPDDVLRAEIARLSDPLTDAFTKQKGPA